MPSKSPAQHRFMEAIAHSPGFAKKAGVPQSVGKDFAQADDKAGITKNPSAGPSNPRNDHMAQRKAAGLNNSQIGKEFGKHRTTVGRALKQGYVKV